MKKKIKNRKNEGKWKTIEAYLVALSTFSQVIKIEAQSSQKILPQERQ